MENQKNLNINLSSTTKVEGENGNVIFQQGYVLRKVSKFVMQSGEDGFMPIPVFYDINSGKIIGDTLPKEIRSDYKEFILE